MKNITKRLVATISSLALVAMLLPTPTAIAASATITISDGADCTTALTNTALVANTTEFCITYTTSAVFASGDAIKVTIKDSAGDLYAQAFQQASTADTDADNQANTSSNGAFNVGTAGVATYTFTGASTGTAIKLTIKAPATLANGIYTINVAEDRVTSTSGDEIFGSVQVNVGSLNQVAVTAVVEPILSMVLSSTAIDLGVLTSTAIATTTNTITIETNAITGYTVSVESDNSNSTDGLYDATSAGLIVATAGDNVSIGASEFGLDAVVTTDSSTGDGTAAVTVGLGDGTVAVDVTAASLVTGDGTTDGDVFTVTYRAAVSAVQEAGNYATTITYSITGNF